MPKKIVICLDGTGNEFKADASNVLRLCRVLQDAPGKQVIYYDPGVGTEGAPGRNTTITQGVRKIYGLAFATGLTENIIEAYRFLMEHYDDGDEVFLFGFSRGAYTARALAGMLHNIGLLDKGRANLVSYATKLYYTFSNFELCGSFKEQFCQRRPEIAFLGLFDTVKSVFYFEPSSFRFVSAVMPFTYQNRSVRVVRHALAIDERRRYYRPNMWCDPTQAKTPYQQDVKQVWFAGVHSDVGGGYDEIESGLAKIPLSWMLHEASAAGLLINQSKQRKIIPTQHTKKISAPDPCAELHESLNGWWWIPEYVPAFRGRTLPRGERRRISEGALVHQSVQDRMDNCPEYSPLNMPKSFQIEP